MAVGISNLLSLAAIYLKIAAIYLHFRVKPTARVMGEWAQATGLW